MSVYVCCACEYFVMVCALIQFELKEICSYDATFSNSVKLLCFCIETHKCDLLRMIYNVTNWEIYACMLYIYIYIVTLSEWLYTKISNDGATASTSLSLSICLSLRFLSWHLSITMTFHTRSALIILKDTAVLHIRVCACVWMIYGSDCASLNPVNLQKKRAEAQCVDLFFHAVCVAVD